MEIYYSSFQLSSSIRRELFDSNFPVADKVYFTDYNRNDENSPHDGVSPV
jgi:hypothetical protein